MIPYARLSPGRGFRPARALFYYAQRMVTWPAARDAAARLIAAGVNWGQGYAAGGPVDGYTARVLGELRADGVSMLAPLADREVVAGMAEYFIRRPVVGPDGGRCWLHELPPEASAAAYDLETVVDCPGLVELLNAPEALQIAAAYLGCKPTVSSLGVRWALPGGACRTTFQHFHRDVDDWRFLKLFVYLTDVDEDAGPHCYVRASHRTAFALNARRYGPSEIEARFGFGAVRTITGERGTTFMADTLGIHRGGLVRSKPRLILQIQYSILPVFAFRYTPVPAAGPPPDAYINRLLLRSAPDPEGAGPAATDRPPRRQMKEQALRG